MFSDITYGYFNSVLKTQTAKYNTSDSLNEVKLYNSLFKPSAKLGRICITYPELLTFFQQSFLKTYLDENGIKLAAINDRFLSELLNVLSDYFNANFTDLANIKNVYHTLLWLRNCDYNLRNLECGLKTSFDWLYYSYHSTLISDITSLLNAYLTNDSAQLNKFRTRYVLARAIEDSLQQAISKFEKRYLSNINDVSYRKALLTFVLTAVLYLIGPLTINSLLSVTPTTTYTSFISTYITLIQSIPSQVLRFNDISDIEIDNNAIDENIEPSVCFTEFINNIDTKYLPQALIEVINEWLSYSGSPLKTTAIVNNRELFDQSDILECVESFIFQLIHELNNVNWTEYEVEHDSKTGTLDLKFILQTNLTNALSEIISAVFTIYYTSDILPLNITQDIINVSSTIASFYNSVSFTTASTIEDLITQYYTTLYDYRKNISVNGDSVIKKLLNPIASYLDISLRNTFLTSASQAVRDFIFKSDFIGFLQSLIDDFVKQLTTIYYQSFDRFNKLTWFSLSLLTFLFYRMTYIINSLKDETNLVPFAKLLLPLVKLSYDDIYKKYASQCLFFNTYKIIEYIKPDLLNFEDRIFIPIAKIFSNKHSVTIEPNAILFFKKVGGNQASTTLTYPLFDDIQITPGTNTVEIQHVNFLYDAVISRFIANNSETCVIKPFSTDINYIKHSSYIDLTSKMPRLNEVINKYLTLNNFNSVYYNNLVSNNFDNIQTGDLIYASLYMINSFRLTTKLTIFDSNSIFYFHILMLNIHGESKMSYYDIDLYDLRQVFLSNNWLNFIKKLSQLSFDTSSRYENLDDENQILYQFFKAWTFEYINLAYDLHFLLPSSKSLCYVLE